MLAYVIRRALQAAATIAIVLVVAFALGRLTGSPAALLLGENATPDQVAALERTLGFDRPLPVQFLEFARGALVGDFGDSYRRPGTPALSIVWERMPATISLALPAFAIGLVLAVVAVLAIYLSASRRLRAVFIWSGTLRHSVPDFFFGLLVVLLFSVALGWLPSLGAATPAAYVLPVLTIATGQFVLYVRLLDSAMAEQTRMDYVRTARAAGRTRGGILVLDVLPNAFLPVLTVAGLNLAMLLGGTVIVEQVFAWPGIGAVLIEAVAQRDFPVVQAALLLVAIGFVVVNVLIDVLHRVLDPRVRIR